MLTMKFHGVETSIAGGGEEIVRAPNPMPFCFFLFLFKSFNICFSVQNMHAAEAMATKNPSDPPLTDLRKKPSSQVPLVWNQPHPSRQK